VSQLVFALDRAADIFTFLPKITNDVAKDIFRYAKTWARTDTKHFIRSLRAKRCYKQLCYTSVF